MIAEKPCVFVVDDDKAVRDALKFALELDGLRICLCDSGATLLGHPSLPEAACIVLDRKMPEMDGFAVVAELLTRKITAPVVLIVSNLTDEVRRRAAQANIAQVLEKPLVGNVLSEAVRAAVRS